jgi:hypothetical protein
MAKQLSKLCRLIPTLILASHCLIAQESALSGVWIQTKTDNIQAKIELAVGPLNFIARPIARKHLTAQNPAYKNVTISISGKEVSVKFDELDPIRMFLGGPPTSWVRADGQKFEVDAELDRDQLIQTFRGDKLERVNLFKLSSDGKIMTMTTTYKMAVMPKDLTYSIQFGR